MLKERTPERRRREAPEPASSTPASNGGGSPGTLTSRSACAIRGGFKCGAASCNQVARRRASEGKAPRSTARRHLRRRRCGRKGKLEKNRKRNRKRNRNRDRRWRRRASEQLEKEAGLAWLGGIRLV
ncbi:unnamed protein product [Prorocentrum cordatum]|uniref:Uncharacterized protein n=1 Tax=Prorocentrum cordatum TaxID=2364126 RepID=A0ABN9XBR1_9DINO|nr:unnamed protein product [Polarella glacialis]